MKQTIRHGALSEERGFAQICELSYRKYADEVRHHPELPLLRFSDYKRKLALEAAGMETVTAEEDGRIAGFILYTIKAENGAYFCDIPLFGCCAEDSRTLDRLFEFLAERAVRGETQLTVHLYAHDLDTQRHFSFLQFHMMSECCIRACRDSAIECGVSIRRLEKTELFERWNEVWHRVSGIIARLRSSPVFYPCGEFTEESYREFLPQCDVYVAEDKGRFVGMIEANAENPSSAFSYIDAVNMGEIYVEPEYRGRGIAEALVSFAEKDQNAAFAWVEHGTANPDARAFWNRHFETYEYLMMRRVN